MSGYAPGLLKEPTQDPDESGEEASEASEGVPVNQRYTGRMKAAVGVLAILSVVAATVFGTNGHAYLRINVNKFVGLSTSHCSDYKRIKLQQTLSSNLGLKGPDAGKPEGIVYSASDYEAPAVNPIRFHINVEGNAPYSYTPAYPQDNGIYGQFGDINLKGGNSVTLVMTATDISDQPTTIPEFDITFFDLDIGASNGANTTEAITIHPGWTAVHISSETQLIKIDNADGSHTYKATMLGRKRDSPTDPEVLDAWQFNKAVTVRYDNFQSNKITLHAYGPGKSGRYFNFILEPTILCVDAGVKPETIVSDATSPAPVAEAKCCTILIPPVELICTDKASKKFWHFMCNEVEAEPAPTPVPASTDEEETAQCCIVRLGFKIGCTAKDQKKFYHFFCD